MAAAADTKSPVAAPLAGGGGGGGGVPSNKVDGWIERLLKCEPLLETEMKLLCELVKAMMMEESNLQPVYSPVAIVGDIHGQFYDLIHMFNKVSGTVPDQKYVFLGDYVDRGAHGVEVMSLLLCLKARHPDCVTLVRGNHESRKVTKTFGFYDECVQKYGSSNVWKYCTEVFDYMPIGAIIDNEILCVHAGLSPSLTTLDQIRLLERNQEIPDEGPITDLMWSDPNEESPDTPWAISSRGSGYLFGAKTVNHWHHINKTTLIARSHQLANEGYCYFFPEKAMVTVWSAPNYTGTCGNKASVLKITADQDQSFVVFDEAPNKVVGKNVPIPDYFL